MRYYDKQGRAISRERWADLAETPEYKIVRQHRLSEAVMVSTVWLGLDHSFQRGSTPIIFETMSFEDMLGAGMQEREFKRYSTERAAIIGHARILRRVAKRQGFPCPREAHGVAYDVQPRRRA
jgi:hypothetical protein